MSPSERQPLSKTRDPGVWPCPGEWVRGGPAGHDSAEMGRARGAKDEMADGSTIKLLIISAACPKWLLETQWLEERKRGTRRAQIPALAAVHFHFRRSMVLKQVHSAPPEFSQQQRYACPRMLLCRLYHLWGEVRSADLMIRENPKYVLFGDTSCSNSKGSAETFCWAYSSLSNSSPLRSPCTEFPSCTVDNRCQRWRSDRQASSWRWRGICSLVSHARLR